MRNTGHRDPTVFTVSIVFEGRARNWLEDPRLLPPFPRVFLVCIGPIRLFLVEYPTKWGQVLRRICGIDGALLEDGISSTRG